MKNLLFLVFIFLLIGCTTKENIDTNRIKEHQKTNEVEKEITVTNEINYSQEKQNKTLPKITPPIGLANLCSGEKECINFCLNNRGRCEAYCKENTENLLCPSIFPYEEDESKSENGVGEKSTEQYKNILDEAWSRGKCEGNGTVQFGVSPMAIEDISSVYPMGGMIHGHVTPIDHLYFYPINPEMKSPPYYVNIYAPADGKIVYAWRSGKPAEKHLQEINDYTLVVEHTCDFYTILGQMVDISPRLKQEIGTLDGGSWKHVRIPIKEGEIVGEEAGISLDYSVMYTGAPAKKWVVPEHYKTSGEPGKKFVIDPFDYYKELIKNQLMEKNVRKVKPYGGEIDYDIDGKLIGTWFQENTNGYAGMQGQNYWKTHVSFSPDAIEPENFVISLGDFNGEARQFRANGNTPNPKDVAVSSGIITYELVDGESAEGIVLVQLMENRKLKVEVFPDKRASQVNGFTQNAKIYER